MCGPAVRVLQRSTGVTTPQGGPSAIRTPSPINCVAALDEYNDANILLPAPKNCDAMQYTETQVVLLLSDTKKGSPICGEMMCKMMRLGYTPGANIRSLQRLMLLHENGKMITDENNNADILLPAPKNHDPMQYTTTEAVFYSLT